MAKGAEVIMEDSLIPELPIVCFICLLGQLPNSLYIGGLFDRTRSVQSRLRATDDIQENIPLAAFGRVALVV